MIVTLTANPSLDRTVELPEPLVRGGVNRAGSVSVEPGGKGINVARVLHAAGHPVRAVLPAAPKDAILGHLDALGLPYRTTRLGEPVRVNLAITEADGTTTKVNEPGPLLEPAEAAELAGLLVLEAEHADWVVLSGSLPPGVPLDWYADLVTTLRTWGGRIAVDTSDAPLLELARHFPRAAPDLLKPNAAELAQLAGADPDAVEAEVAAGELDGCLAAAEELLRQGVGAVLATLGGAGAVLVTPAGRWRATPPPVTVRSTVGAGDSSLAGYLLADVRGATPAERLRTAVAYGSAAAGLAGTALPGPDHLDLGSTGVETLS